MSERVFYTQNHYQDFQIVVICYRRLKQLVLILASQRLIFGSFQIMPRSCSGEYSLLTL